MKIIKGLVHPKMKILSLITHPHHRSTPVRPSFILETQIKIFLMKSGDSVRPALPAMVLPLSRARKELKNKFKTVHVTTVVQP